MPINAIDLFCGAGGLTRGLLDAGVNVRAGYDIDKNCAFPYERNNDGAQYISRSVDNVTRDEIVDMIGVDGIRLIAGCAPCQPFSKYRQGQDTRKDEKWRLLYQFERIVRQVRPELVTMENVPELAKHSIFDDFKTSLEIAGYHVDAAVVDCRTYGVPQCRQRMVLVASLLGPIEIPPATHGEKDYPSVRDAIGHLPPIEAGHNHPDDPLHCSSRLSDLNMKRMRQSRPGGTWRDWDPELVAECHKKSSGKTYPSVYGRMTWDAPSPTMTTQCFGFGNGRFGHPVQDRAISLREAAIFQTFPPDYLFVPDDKPVQMKSVGRMIGNAVPVRLGEVIGLHLLKHVEKYI